MSDCFLSSERLAAYADSSLSAGDRAGVEQHLAGCPKCRGELEFLRSLAAQSAALPRQIEPARDLWVGIERRIAVEAPPRRTVRWPLLAAAAVVLIAASSAITFGVLKRPGPAPIATGEHPLLELPAGAGAEAQALAALIVRVKELEDSLPANTRALVSSQLAQIDAAIAESKMALAGGQATTAVTHMLSARYQQRLDLLEQAERVARKS